MQSGVGLGELSFGGKLLPAFQQWDSFFYHRKTLSETDFLSVSILDSCIEMPHSHKLPLSQYLSDWSFFISVQLLLNLSLTHALCHVFKITLSLSIAIFILL